MTQVSRELVDGPVDIRPVAIPSQEATTGECVSEIVETWPNSSWRDNPRHGLLQELVEGVPHRPIAQSLACVRHEEGRVP